MKLLLVICVLAQYSLSVPINNNIPNIKDEIAESISAPPIRKKAMGRIAGLGDFYDARTESFMEISLYTQEISSYDEDIVHSTDVTHADIDYVIKETIDEKRYKLGVDADLYVSVLFGMVTLSGSARYLNEDKKKSRSAKTTLVYKLQTKQEQLKLFSNKSMNAINRYLLEAVDATHVVVGLEWGADIIISLEDTETGSSNDLHIKGKELRATIWLAVLAIYGTANADYHDLTLDKNREVELHINADIIPNQIPQTLNETMEFVKNIPDLIKSENNGRGKIKEYIMMPIATVRKIFNVHCKKPGVVKELQKNLMNQIMKIFQEMSDSKLEINDAYNDIEKWSLMVPENELEGITEKKNEFNLFCNQLRTDFSEQVVLYRHGKSSTEKLNNLITKYYNSDWTPALVSRMLEVYEASLTKIKLLNLLERYSSRFLDRKTDKYKVLAVEYHQEIKIISVNLNMAIQSLYIGKIVGLLENEMAKGSNSVDKGVVNGENSDKKEKEKNEVTNIDQEKDKLKPIPYYIEDDLNATIPYVTGYLKGQIVDSYSLNKTEYVLLISAKGNVTILNATSYKTAVNYSVDEFENSSFAVANDKLYKIDTKKGSISSTHVSNIFTSLKNSTKWEHVGSFPSESTLTESSTAVDGSSFYFISNNGNLYKYDTIWKTVTRKANIKDICIGKETPAASSMSVYNGTLYINTLDKFCSFDGVKLNKLVDPDHSSKRSGLFVSKNRICRVGSQEKETSEKNSKSINLIQCFNTEKKEWEDIGTTNEGRDCPGVATTYSGTIIFSGSEEAFISAEIFNDNTSVLSYIPIPLSIVKGCYFATSVFY